MRFTRGGSWPTNAVTNRRRPVERKITGRTECLGIHGTVFINKLATFGTSNFRANVQRLSSKTFDRTRRFESSGSNRTLTNFQRAVPTKIRLRPCNSHLLNPCNHEKDNGTMDDLNAGPRIDAVVVKQIPRRDRPDQQCVIHEYLGCAGKFEGTHSCNVLNPMPKLNLARRNDDTLTDRLQSTKGTTRCTTTKTS